MKRISQRVLFGVLAGVVILYGVGTLLLNSTDVGYAIPFSVGVAVVFLAGFSYFAVISSRARAAARRLRVAQPDASVYIAQFDTYFLGSIVQLRPNIPNVMAIWGWSAYCVSPRGFEIWGGRRGQVCLFDISWEYVRSITVDEARLGGVTFPAIVTILKGAEVLPLRLILHPNGIRWLRPMSQTIANETLDKIESFRTAAAGANTTESGR